MSDLRARADAVLEPLGVTPRDPIAETMAQEYGVTVASAAPEPADPADSGIPAEMDATVFVAWSRVMGDVQYIRKTRQKGSQLNYAFRGIDAVLNAVGPVLRKHGVIVVQTGVQPEYSTVPTANDKIMNYCRVTVTYAVFGPRGDRLPVDPVSVGEAFDSGDKSTPKAVSVALRSLFLNTLAIPTDAPEMDPEHGPQYEMAAPPPPTPMSYRDEITDPRTPRDRLRQIYRELGRHPDLGGALVPGRDGAGQTTLADLLTAVIAERFPQKAEG